MYFLYRLKQSIVAFGDLSSYSIGLFLALMIRTLSLPSGDLIHKHLVLFGIVFFFWIIANFINGLYDVWKDMNTARAYRRLAESAMIAFVLSIIFFYIVPEQTIAPKTILLLTFLIGYGLSCLWRFGCSQVIGSKTLQTNVLFVGSQEETQELVRILSHHLCHQYRVAGVVDVLDLERMIKAEKIDLVVIAPNLRTDSHAVNVLYRLLFLPIQIIDLTTFYERITGRIPTSTFSEGWFLDHLRHAENPVYDKFRALVDYLMSIVLAFLFFLLFPLIALGIRMSSTGPLFIRQKRIGKDGRIFTLYKFRSMYALHSDGSAEVSGVQFAHKHDKRITPFGQFLRKAHLDEIPQWINLLRREVTLIGPRPERPEIVKELTERMAFYPLRHVVRPGLTGWAAIHQNYTDTFETSLEKLQYDFFYIKNRSFLLDLSILLRTLNELIRLKGQ